MWFYTGMSQPGAKVITRKHAHLDSNVGPSSPLSRGKSLIFFLRLNGVLNLAPLEGSSCSVRIYQRRRVSSTEMEVTDTSVGVSAIDCGKRRQFSVQSRHASIQVGRAPSLARVKEGGMLGLSLDSLALGEGSGVLGGERCTSPVSLKTCNGFCEREDAPLRSATVVCCLHVCACVRA